MKEYILNAGERLDREEEKKFLSFYHFRIEAMEVAINVAANEILGRYPCKVTSCILDNFIEDKYSTPF